MSLCRVWVCLLYQLNWTLIHDCDACTEWFLPVRQFLEFYFIRHSESVSRTDLLNGEFSYANEMHSQVLERLDSNGANFGDSALSKQPPGP